MSNHRASNNNPALSDEAALFWQARMQSGAMSEQEKSAFTSWLKDANNRAAFDRLESSLSMIDAAGQEILADVFERELNALSENRSPLGRYALIAASLVLFVAAVVFSMRGFDVSLSGAADYATAIGERDKVSLVDGSIVELNTASKIEVSIDRDHRRVALTGGQAFFSVERDSSRPFSVSTGQAEILVTGTVFDVNTFNGESVICVVSGMVEVRPTAGGQIMLMAGDGVVIDASGLAGDVQRFDANQMLSWRIGKLRFKEAPLGRVVTELNRYYGKPIMLADSDLAEIPVSGEFDVDDQENAIRSITLVSGLKSDDATDRIILKRSAGRNG